MTLNLPDAENLCALVAIVRAAHLAGDRRLERVARRELRYWHGVKVIILDRLKRREPKTAPAQSSAGD